MKESVLIFCDNDISHNIPLTGIADILEKKEYQVLFCGGSKNRSYFESRNIEYRVIEAFNQIKSNVKNDVDMGFFELNFLDAITNKEFKSIENIKPSMVLLPYYISYLFPFLKKKYFEVKFCCVNILLRGELFTPEYLFNFHYSALDSISKKKIAQILGKVEINLNNVIRDYYIDFKEFILCPKELDISDKFIGQNVEYSEAIVGNPKEYTEDLNKNNLIIFSMGSNSHLFPLVINSLVEKIVQCAILLKCYDQSFEMILSIPDGVLNPSVKGLCKRKNLELVNWFDQNDLLSKAKVMITHCGVGSLKECIYTMTPMLCFPLTRDQPYNANRVETLKLGKTLHPVDTDAKKIFDSLIELIEDKDYQQNLKEFRKLFYNYKEKETLYNQLTQLTA